MLESMRRRDLITLFILAGIVLYSWQALKPPKVDESQLPPDYAALNVFSKWSGSVEKAQAEDGSVKGASTDDPGSLNEKPPTLLLVEEYNGAPFTYSLGEMLKANNVTVYPEDIVEVFPAPELGLGSTIRIYRATPVKVTDWGKEKSYRTWENTVGDFLAEQGIELGDNDRVEPAASTPLSISQKAGEEQSAKLVITRVAITEVKVKEKIDFKKIEKEDPELPRGQIKVDKGILGERTQVFKVTRENGVEVKRELIKNEVTKEPKDEIKIIGTKVVIGKSFTGKASWYKYDSTKVATDLFKRGVNLRITNLSNGKQIFVKNDGCICSDTGYVVDLHPDHFKALGGVISDGVLKNVKIDEVLN